MVKLFIILIKSLHSFESLTAHTQNTFLALEEMYNLLKTLYRLFDPSDDVLKSTCICKCIFFYKLQNTTKRLFTVTYCNSLLRLE